MMSLMPSDHGSHYWKAVVGVLGLLLVWSSPVLAEDWLQWGGPKGDYTIDVEGLADWWPEGGPTVVWERPLGGGYTSIVTKGDRIYTMYRDGEEEVVVALDAATGETRWEHRYSVELWPDMTPAFGSGPNATPAIVADRIVSISIDGQVRCLDLATGDLLWSHDMPAEYGRRAREEEYGYSGSPLAVDGKVIVLVGGDDHGVVAFDPADGSTVWESEPGGISYAPATLTTLNGRLQYVYFSPEGVRGLDPSGGEILWHHEMEYNNGNHLTPIVKGDESHIWVGSQFPSGGGRLLRVDHVDGMWSAERLWFQANLRASHWTSIRLGDYIYGSTGGNEVSVLTAFDWRTGDIAWRQRGFHKAQSLYADGKLLSLDEGGQLTLARVSPSGLEVLARAQVTQSISWTLPTLVGTTLYLRDTENILALDLADSGGERVAGAEVVLEEPAELLGEFGRFVAEVDAADNKRELIDNYLAQQETFPIVENDSLVHFVFRGDVPDIGVQGNFLDLGEFQPLYRVAGTDLYFRSYRLPPAAHFEYQFNVFEERMPDPLNPRVLTAGDDGSSVVTTAGWSEPAHLAEPEGERGRIESFLWKSAILDNEREIKVYLPPGYDEGDRRYPLVVVNYGDLALEQGRWANSLDNLIGESVAPLIAVFLPRVNFDEYAPQVEQFSQAIAEELLPRVDEHYRTLPGAGNRAMTGIASGGFASILIALTRPELIGNVAVQSFYLRSEVEEAFRAAIEDGDRDTTRFYVEWSVNDLEGGGDLHSEAASRELVELLETAGYEVITNEVVDGAGWGSWRARNDRVLESFLPLEP